MNDWEDGVEEEDGDEGKKYTTCDHPYLITLFNPYQLNY